MKLSSVLLMLVASAYVNADTYMHNPRGSNNRLNGQNNNANNANRMFDSQNNNKGGYCWGPALYYYEGSVLPIEWTSQHACGNDKTDCNVVLQYMCGDTNGPVDERIRDGTTTDTIPDDVNTFNTVENNEFVYGMHESYNYYQQCKTRSRNQGLFLADQNVGGAARNTRQNNNGNRRGFECPEERDYYPYWHPSPWKDIAILTHDTDMCTYYEEQSQNVQNKGWCDGEPQFNNMDDCNGGGGTWTVDSAWNIPEPDCLEAPYNRDNHLGNGFSGQNNQYNWTIPSMDIEPCIESDSCVCVLRLRYNISTADTDNWPGDDGAFIDASANGEESPITNDPTVDVEGNAFELAIDTSQFARTFQDRSHVFSIKERPSEVGLLSTIYNVNVRGKRGNIVQTYPATEYDFVPDHLHMKINDYIHWQWTGCDTNPANNAGEGTSQTDRSNVVQLWTLGHNYPLTYEQQEQNDVDWLFPEAEVRQRMAQIDQTNCLSYEELLVKNGNDEGDVEEDIQNCMKLNAAPTPYFDGGLQQMSTLGTYYYMSTRNNNFTNRGQKGTIIVETLLAPAGIALVTVGAVVVTGGAAAGGAAFYAHKNPHSQLGNWIQSWR